MRKLLRKAHYGTTCPGVVHVPQNMRIFLASISRRARIGFTPFLLLKPRAFKPASGEETMSSSERRIDTRVNVRVPLRFRVLNNPGSTEQTAQSENISQRGLYFMTNVPPKIGTPVEVSLRMPQEVAGRVANDVKCMARVVHVKQSSAPRGMSGIGLHIERYEAKASARERWAS
jgi:PilZ domain-containing protein